MQADAVDCVLGQRHPGVGCLAFPLGRERVSPRIVADDGVWLVEHVLGLHLQLLWLLGDRGISPEDQLRNVPYVYDVRIVLGARGSVR